MPSAKRLFLAKLCKLASIVGNRHTATRKNSGGKTMLAPSSRNGDESHADDALDQTLAEERDRRCRAEGENPHGGQRVQAGDAAGCAIADSRQADRGEVTVHVTSPPEPDAAGAGTRGGVVLGNRTRSRVAQSGRARHPDA